MTSNKRITGSEQTSGGEAPKITMPDLPEPDVTDGHTFACHSDDVIREYGLACLRAGMEAAAQICDRMRSVSAVSYETGEACAAAIRRAAEGAIKP